VAEVGFAWEHWFTRRFRDPLIKSILTLRRFDTEDIRDISVIYIHEFAQGDVANFMRDAGDDAAHSTLQDLFLRFRFKEQLIATHFD